MPDAARGCHAVGMQHHTVAEHLTGLRVAVDALARYATEAGPDTDVPTCPRWTVRKLVAHQGMVHRWARANLLGEDCSPPAWNAEGQEVADPVGWLREGAADLAATLEEMPDDVRAMVFLKDAPLPRVFWARRQCHETTIHAVDALAAALGRVPSPQDVGWVDCFVALDGIDEMLTGFVTRGTARFAGVGPLRFDVRLTDSALAWSLEVQADGRVVTTRTGADTPPEAGAAVVRGPAVAAYLALWNRTTPEAVDDAAGIVTDVWRQRAKVRWS